MLDIVKTIFCSSDDNFCAQSSDDEIRPRPFDYINASVSEVLRWPTIQAHPNHALGKFD